MHTCEGIFSKNNHDNNDKNKDLPAIMKKM